MKPIALLAASMIALASPIVLADSHAKSEPKITETGKATNISVFEKDGVRLHTYYGISNSHIIETDNELHLVDAQMTFKSAQGLSNYIDTLGKPLVQVILSHNHPDHWFGAEVFSNKGYSVATTNNITTDLAEGGARYIKILKKKLGDQIPDSVIKPDAELSLGAHNWDGLDVTVEEYSGHEAHNSIVIKIPSAGVMIGQDLFYNKMFLVASERERNKHWVEILENFQEIEAKEYGTILVGHGRNSGTEVFANDIAYLNALEATLEKGLTQEETKAEMIDQFPDYKAEGMLNISMRNLYSAH